MSLTVAEGVNLARLGEHPAQVCLMKSGWLVLADMQYLSGYSILLADPVVEAVNELSEAQPPFLQGYR